MPDQPQAHGADQRRMSIMDLQRSSPAIAFGTEMTCFGASELRIRGSL
jgi:hypothetical protein